MRYPKASSPNVNNKYKEWLAFHLRHGKINMSENVAPQEQNPLVNPKTPSETPKPQASQESTDPTDADPKVANPVLDLQNFSTLRTVLVDDQHSFVMMMKVKF